MENINIKDINSDLYEIKSSELKQASILYVDFHYEISPKSKSIFSKTTGTSMPVVAGPVIFTKAVTLGEVQLDMGLTNC